MLGFDFERDTNRQFTLREWVDALKFELDHYVEVWEGKNEFFKSTHKWAEWMGNFVHWLYSW